MEALLSLCDGTLGTVSFSFSELRADLPIKLCSCFAAGSFDSIPCSHFKDFSLSVSALLVLNT